MNRHIGHVYCAPFQDGAAGERTTAGRYWIFRQILYESRIRHRVRKQIKLALVQAPDDGSFGRAEALRGPHDRFDYRLQLRWRATDDSENLTGRRLVLK